MACDKGQPPQLGSINIRCSNVKKKWFFTIYYNLLGFDFFYLFAGLHSTITSSGHLATMADSVWTVLEEVDIVQHRLGIRMNLLEIGVPGHRTSCFFGSKEPEHIHNIYFIYIYYIILYYIILYYMYDYVYIYNYVYIYIINMYIYIMYIYICIYIYYVYIYINMYIYIYVYIYIYILCIYIYIIMYIYNYVYITSTNINQLFIKKLITSLSSIILHQHLFVQREWFGMMC